jgi:transposase
VRDWLPANHLVFLLEDVIEQFDLCSIYETYSQDGRGGKVFSPRMMLWLLLYAWCRKAFSSRAIAKLALEDIGGRVIVGDTPPNFRTINLFRQRLGASMKSIFVDSVHLCMQSGLVSLECLGIDGTKIKANASMDRSNSLKVLNIQEKRLEAEIDALLERSRQLDDAEDELYGADNAGPTVSEDLADRNKRRERLRAAKEALKQRAVEKEHAALERWNNTPDEDRRKDKEPLADPNQAEPLLTDQYNFVDADSRILKQLNGSFIQGYNAQIAVDSDYQVIVAANLANNPTDHYLLTPLVDLTIEHTSCVPGIVLADKGYHSKANLAALKSRGTRGCIPARGKKADPLSAEDKLLYKKRSSTVEPVFGHIKGNLRSPGFRAFLRRGLEKCQQEWFALCAVHNICKYMRFAV